jgi:putative transposase
MNDRWLDRSTLQSLTGWSLRAIQQKVKGCTLISRLTETRQRNGRNLREYSAISLPAEFQIKLAKQCAQPSSETAIVPVVTGLIQSAGSDLVAASTVNARHIVNDEQQKEAEQRYKVISPLIEFAKGTKGQRTRILSSEGKPFTNSDELAKHIAAEHGFSRAKIWRWYGRYKKDGLPGLLDKVRSDKGKSHWMERHVEAKAIVAAEYLSSGQNKQAAYESLERWWRSKGFELAALPHYETVRAWLESSDMPAALKALARDGEQRHNERMLPYLRRAYTDIGANQIWISDHMIHDMLVRNDCFDGVPEDAQMRLRLTMWLDMRSRKAVGYSWTPEGSSRSIVTAYRMGALQYGDPLQVYTDNGRDYIKSTKSGVKFERGPVNEQFLQDAVWLEQGALFRLGVAVQHCLKYHPQSKHIERFFRTLHMHFDSIFPHYTTGNAYNRPDKANIAMAEHKKLLVMGRGNESPLVPASEFIRMGVTWIEQDYNNAPHSGEGMEGLSPNHVFDELYPFDKRRKADRLALDQLLYERVKRRVDSCAVRLPGRRYIAANAESAAAMYLANETDIIVCYDPHARTEAIATDLDGKKLADLKEEQLVPHSDAAQPMIADSMQERRRLRNAMKETEQHIKRTAKALGHTSAFEDLRARAELPKAAGGFQSPFITQRVGSERIQPHENAVAPASAAEIAEAAMRFLRP